ncbi:hypothetical protein P167DRAFT_537157 [Morchella conica CCBAS932]|uniref:Uncharacterized protein n=1 Tax=Morchella conica CCBAS932 TaxID=1392247 RepID=A0A3N4KK28_9PEZI|nr:hypothetical protein P167DRAFT_537157 [Morchella conica CCBAS932]
MERSTKSLALLLKLAAARVHDWLLVVRVENKDHPQSRHMSGRQALGLLIITMAAHTYIGEGRYMVYWPVQTQMRCVL